MKIYGSPDKHTQNYRNIDIKGFPGFIHEIISPYVTYSVLLILSALLKLRVGIFFMAAFSIDNKGLMARTSTKMPILGQLVKVNTYIIFSLVCTA